MPAGVCSVGNGGSDSSRKSLSTCLSVETGLGFCGILGSSNDAMEPLSDANESAAIVGDVDDQLLGTRCFEVL